MLFSHKVVLAFSGIVLAPLLLLYGVTIALVYKQTVNSLASLCSLEVHMNEEKIYENIQSLELIDKMIRANRDLILFITSPENRSEDDVIRIVKDESLTLERILSVEPLIYAIRVFSKNNLVPERFPVILHAERESLAELSEWEFNYKAKFIPYMDSQSSNSVCLTRELSNGRKTVGWIQLAMRMENFFPFLHRNSVPYQRDFVLRVFKDSTGKRFSQVRCERKKHKEGMLSESDLKNLEKYFFKENPKETFTTKLNGANTVIAWRYLPKLGIVIAHSCEMAMVKKYEISMFFILIAMLFVGFGFFSIVRYTANRLFNGIYSVMGGMQKVNSGNLSVQIPVDGMNEVREAQLTFNAMTRQLSAQIEQIRTEQQLIADTEMKAMQNQINAHFLYNVLETIHMQAVLADNEDIAESILMLGKMLRYCLRWRIHTVALEQEMEYIQSYVYILNLRNDYEITLEFDIPQDLRKIKIPKMILQPFVENSFIHGIEPLAQSTKVCIYTEAGDTENKIWLCVRDYGSGMSETRLKEIRTYLDDEKYERDSTGSIGIKNIQQRLSLFYGPEFKLEIKSELNKGTVVRIPLLIKGEKHAEDSNS
ncbi:sensor histidine kinase [Treponema zioleckii]|uniref:sensor histidine kinase n=1 Tax=Treponema zioleckii TaxID=331680 RepID=UPI00168C0C6F|nr:histidine kinase [Treponema zioleckii]